MNKSELVAAVAGKLAGAEPDARQYVDAVFDTIMDQVATGERVQIIGFGTFDSVARAARVGHNPRSQEPIQVPASVAPRFQAGQTFRAQVKESLAPSAEVAAAKSPTVAVAAAVEKAAKTKSAKKPAAEKKVAEKKVAETKVVAEKKPVAEKKVVAEKPVKAAKEVKAEPVKSKAEKTATKKSAKAGKSGKK